MGTEQRSLVQKLDTADDRCVFILLKKHRERSVLHLLSGALPALAGWKNRMKKPREHAKGSRQTAGWLPSNARVPSRTGDRTQRRSAEIRTPMAESDVRVRGRKSDFRNPSRKSESESGGLACTPGAKEPRQRP